MGAEPRCTHRPEGRGNVAVLRVGVAPQIGVVVGDEAAAVIQLSRGALAVRHHAGQQGKQRFLALRQAADVGGPVVHLGVDVDRILGVPRWEERVVPDALQIGGQAARAAGRKQKPPPVLEVQRVQPRVGLCSGAPQAFVGGQGLQGGVCGKGEAAGIKIIANIFGISPFKNNISLFGRGVKAGGDGLQGFGLAVGRSGGQQEGCRLRAAQKQRIADSPRRAAVVLGQADRGGKADAVGIAREIDRCIVQVPCLFAAFAVQAAAQGESLRRIGRQPQDEHAIRVGDERLPRVVRAAHGEADVERARVQVKATAVVVGFGGQSVKIQRQIAQRLVCTHAARGRGQPIQREPFGIGQAALAEQFLDFGQRGRGVGVQAVHRAAAPQAVLIQLELLARDTTELHTAKASVARGQRRIPIRSRLGVPKLHTEPPLKVPNQAYNFPLTIRRILR